MKGIHKMTTGLALAFTCAMTVIFVGACSCSPTDKDDVKSQASTPEISVIDNKISWTLMTGNSKYEVWFNDGEKQTLDVNYMEFPTVAGDYELYLRTKGGDSLLDSEVTKFSFSVENAVLPVYEKSDYEYTFSDVENCEYRVNGGEWQAFASNVLNYNNVSTYGQYTVEYYRKGSGWNEVENVYITDSLKDSFSLTVKETLALPKLTFDGLNTNLTWGAVENAADYTLGVNGTEITLTSNSYTLPAEIGVYNVWVRANVAESNATLANSRKAYLYYEVKEAALPEVTVNGSTVYLDEVTATHVETSTDSTFSSVTGNSITITENMCLRVKKHYDEKEQVLYLPSKALSIKQRGLPQVTFSKEGTLAWGADDAETAVIYGYKLWKETETEPIEYTLTNEKMLSLKTLEAGQYVLTMSALSYLDKDAGILYTDSTSLEQEFTVLQAPKIEYIDKRLRCSDMDENASTYQYKIEDGEYSILIDDGAIISQKGKYYVNAIGSDENYVVTSTESVIEIDPVYDIDNDKITAAENQLFRVVLARENDDAIVEPTYVSDEQSPSGGAIQGKMQIMKVKCNPVTINVGDTLLVTYKIQRRLENVGGGIHINDIWLREMDAQASEGYFTQSIIVTAGTIKQIGNRITNIWLRDYAKNKKDGITTIDFVSFEIKRKQQLSAEQLENGFKVTSADDNYYVSKVGKSSEVVQDPLSSSGYAIHSISNYQSTGVQFGVNKVELKAGDKISVTLRGQPITNKGTVAGVGLSLNGTWKTGIAAANTSETEYVTMTATISEADLTDGVFILETIIIAGYIGNNGQGIDELWISGISIIRATE